MLFNKIKRKITFEVALINDYQSIVQVFVVPHSIADNLVGDGLAY